MAAATTLSVMTLGPQQKVIVTTTGAPGNQNILPSPAGVASQQKRPGVVVNMTTATNSAAPASSPDNLRCKRRINFTYSGLPGHQPASVARRNARERNRVKQVNNGFATLRSRIPLSVAAALSSSTGSGSGSGGRGASKKLSKVETLRLAVEYIRSLQQLLDDHASETNSTTSSTPETTTSNLTTTYSSSPESGVNMTIPQHLGHPLHIQQQSSLSPPCSEASSSPTPSYASEGSSYAPTSVYQQENYENYEPMSPEDEELLDVISWWQQSQW
ncbi:hypothetical protein L9F63_026267 [Diploptera punctata]|uniref:BHLH domain-containing protein n=1 Tax=Diploptera punctata TaxID=6984 RepID=A0AAD8EFD4_DIPPU|nr:hypothetical protein L9F63_018919 [Diploptera punctata]KAJ9600596.1 hypothetical protein L9F63_026267 [Diploptera punctata]